MGRIDKGRLEWICEHWHDPSVNRKKEVELSVLTAVNASDEWCYETYMETDYGAITQYHFEKVVGNYPAFRLLGTSGLPELAPDDDDG